MGNQKNNPETTLGTQNRTNTNKTKTKKNPQKTKRNEQQGSPRKSGGKLDGFRITYGSCN
jgi:hypothetical protein